MSLEEGEDRTEKPGGEGPVPSQEAKTRADLFAFLDALGIAHKNVEHPAIFTVEEGRDYKKAMPGGHSKNLFLKDKKGALYLAVALGETQVDLVGLGKRLGAKGRLSFGKPELMTATMGVIPGAVTPFALVNDSARALSAVILDTALLAHDPVWFHPLENTASTAVSSGDLVKFVEACGFEPRILDLAAPFEG
ncbi:prolyl-tRNA synthetase associated domain-containing protein [Hyphococcus sp.]|uniref:prolyl-tRNA synthetase associated domain-containing protein n=1 Tax=Hyphococcus sp. TaxID=2038636 RepID=UPI003D131D90